MESMASDSESNFSEKSWHLLSLLLRIGHPVLPQHLASTCKLFPASPDLVLHLMSLPGSPIFVTDNGLVTPSAAAVCALGRFFSVSISRRFVLGIGFRAPTEQQLCCFSALGKRKTTDLDVVELVPAAKRRLFFSYGEGGTDPKRLTISHCVPRISLESYADAEKAMTIGNIPTVKFDSQYTHGENAMIPLRVDTNVECSDDLAPKFECREADNETDTSVFQGEITGSVIKASDSLFMTGNGLTCQKVVGTDRSIQCDLFIDLNLPTCLQDASVCNEASGCSIELEKKMEHFEILRHEYPEQNNIHPAGDICKNNTCENPIGDSNNEYENTQGENGSKKGVIRIGTEQEKEGVTQKGNLAPCGEEPKNDVKSINHVLSLNLDKEETVKNIGNSAAKQLLKSSCILKGGQKNDSHTKLQVLTESLTCNIAGNAPKNVDKSKNDQKIIARNKMKQIRKENATETTSMTPKGERKAYPSFETFNIEEEEGSGGYGTVYRARRKTDGKRLAIKCPHNNAHKNHINNERNMLERFGGKNFIIKFEGSFKTGSSDCFVLEHVEHDRPEVLKREIDIVQLQWYGYCLFRALACLHKEGVVHRDVKPGNFLFSRKLNKGYLIDFNLAMDLKQKFNVGRKSKPGLDATSSIPLPSGSNPLVQDKNLGGSKPLTSNKRDLADYKKNPELNRHVKQKAYAGPLKNCPDKAGASLLKTQGTDGSGITSAKDGTSTRTVSAERLREPLPFKGRKELISLVQNSMQCASNSLIKGPASQRKRIIAPSGKVDGKHVYLTPMPLHSSTIAAGSLRSKGDVKHKREGSCVGTKGFRAPEVLFRSQFQGPKVDIWSAGVTLLYFVLGKAPFSGEPEQNIKEIAKLRGSEDLWEVAKLHDRDLSFPVELLDERYLQSWDIERWCKLNTKRPEFLEHIPKSLYDLIDKCLTVNPRNRICVEDVLRHEFFASCNELQKKQRMIRRGFSSDIATSTST